MKLPDCPGGLWNTTGAQWKGLGVEGTGGNSREALGRVPEGIEMRLIGQTGVPRPLT